MPCMQKNEPPIGAGKIFNELLKEVGTPVEFELPNSFDKWKPMPYRFIKRNIYLTKKAKRRSEDDGIFCSCSSSSESSGVCDRDCHCGMLLSTCSSGCKCGSSCQNQPFQNRHQKEMKLVKTERCGSGIVADEDIKQGEFVIEYVGEVIDDQTCEERLWKMKDRGETNFYLCEINRDTVIDATFKGNKSRYINHSCSPNTELQKWRIDGETRIGIFSTRDIKKGEELNYDYKFVQFGADQSCHCGAVSCRQKLGSKINKPKIPSSEETFKLVSAIVAARRSGKAAEASSSGKDDVTHRNEAAVYKGGLRSHNNINNNQERRRLGHNCIDDIVRIAYPAIDVDDGSSEETYRYGLIQQFDNKSRKHKILFEDGKTETLDLARESWDRPTYQARD
ncbi:histone-lysine N-methyltransferase ASHH3 isoform X3 [Impatiens glandulifera]|uniref:histone-lysine N-methyltransferase ASHH3 isoform X3 n=1 Tax=Impatiens glandulifera TaxID=253017 RepID=UPI001FB104AB|nr:histone-lysine N-methyltransferase ASHH3 isoform X3 [Impatiens glandulifera]XP_047317126.1 histone-lysine N-methyltransferase ASHH3 isoform X3 [Impatiens glandulifera]